MRTWFGWVNITESWNCDWYHGEEVYRIYYFFGFPIKREHISGEFR